MDSPKGDDIFGINPVRKIRLEYLNAPKDRYPTFLSYLNRPASKDAVLEACYHFVNWLLEDPRTGAGFLVNRRYTQGEREELRETLRDLADSFEHHFRNIGNLQRKANGKQAIPPIS